MAAALAVALACPPARAEGPAPAAPAAEEVAPKVVRIVVAKLAAEKLSALRVRRLVELQLGGDITVPEEPAGPLDENAVRVYVDLPEPATVEVQVQAPGRRLEARRVDVSGLPWEVASRFVSIATSELVRGQLAPRRKAKPRPPTPDEIAAKMAAEPSFELSALIEGAYVGDLEEGVFGSRLAASFHQAALSERVSIGLLGGSSGGSWIDLDVAALHRFWFGPDFRLGLGAGFALALLDGGPSPRADALALWVRPHALAYLDVRVGEHAMLGLDLDPGLSVDPASRTIGPWLGGGLHVAFDGATRPKPE